MNNPRTQRIIAMGIALFCLSFFAAFAGDRHPFDPAFAEPGRAETVPTPTPTPVPTPTPTPAPRPALLKGAAGAQHTAYLNLPEDGSVRPDAALKRAEAAQMLYALTEQPSYQQLRYADVSFNDWYYAAANALTAAGVFDAEAEIFGPDELLSRAEFVHMLAAFFTQERGTCPFCDVSAATPYCDDLVTGAVLGWLTADESGCVRPEEPVSRAEAVTMINRAFGRRADEDYLTALCFSPFSDLDTDDPAYAEFIEAVLPHTGEAEGSDEHWTNVDSERLHRAQGLYFAGGDLYDIAEDGLPVRDTTIGGIRYGEDGRATCGDAEVDGYVRDILAQITTPEMTQLERLYAAYVYCRDEFAYLRRNYYATGETGWELEEARIMFETGRGNCYCYAAAFCYLARGLGYDACAYSGLVGSGNYPHGWVEIEMDGTVYLFDCEQEMAFTAKGQPLDLFMVAPGMRPWNYYR